MSRAESLSDEERKLTGDLLRSLRIVNELNQNDVAAYIGASAQAVSNYEAGKDPISAARALNLLLCLVATADDKQKVEDLVSSIPALKREVRFRELVEQAEQENRLNAYGTVSWISTAMGLSRQTVRARLAKRTLTN